MGPFEAFVHAETRTFLSFFTRLGARRSEAEDLAQETFLKLFRLAAPSPSSSGPSSGPDASARSTYESRGQFRGFAFRVARNVWIDRSRKRASEPRSVEEDFTAPDPSAPQPLQYIEQLEESSRIRAAVATLSEAHRSVFELGVIEELPYAEISAALDIPVGTVKSRMFHAVHRVREALEESDRVHEAIVAREPRSGATLRTGVVGPSGSSYRAPNARPRTL